MSERKINRIDKPKETQYGRWRPENIYFFGIAALYCATVLLIVVVCFTYFFVIEHLNTKIENERYYQLVLIIDLGLGSDA